MCILHLAWTRTAFALHGALRLDVDSEYGDDDIHRFVGPLDCAAAYKTKVEKFVGEEAMWRFERSL